MPKKNEIVIQSFEITIGETKVSLTREQAEQLRDALVETLGAKQTDFDELKRKLDEIRGRDTVIPSPYPVPWPYPDPRHIVHGGSVS